MTLPHRERAHIDQSKIRDYLLALDHPEGACKAIFFSRFGFTVQDWEVFAAALVVHAQLHAVIETSAAAYGTKYCIDGTLQCPDGRAPQVRSVWVIDANADFPRLITAYPL